VARFFEQFANSSLAHSSFRGSAKPRARKPGAAAQRYHPLGSGPALRASRNDEQGNRRYYRSMSRFELIAVYIMASARNGTLYLGVTGNLIQRAYQHREGLIEGFSKRYGCKQLVWYERYEEIGAAIVREKDIKKWRRAWKLNLIEKTNPQWRDLYDDFANPRPPTFL
jgi:putative endonuclease